MTANENTTAIRVVNKSIIVPNRFRRIIVENDSNSQVIPIIVDRYYDGNDLSQYTMTLKTVSRGGRDDIEFLPSSFTVTDGKIQAEWTVKPPQTSYNGRLGIQISFSGTAANGEVFKWETKSTCVDIIISLNASPVVPETPSAYETFLDQLSILAEDTELYAQRAEAAALISPYIGQNGSWYVYDPTSGECADTGVAAHGADGQSAYQAAQLGGYTDTEQAFYLDLAAIYGLAAQLEALL